METPNISLFLAFSAGVLSFASPCVLPLVPAYLGHLTGAVQAPQSPSTPRRWSVLLHAIGFVVGFSVVFTLLGASIGLVGHLLYSLRAIFQKVGGLILILLGLHTMGLLRIPFLYRELRLQVRPAGRWGRQRLAVLSSFLVGTIFAAAWTPCVGPILAGILVLAAASGTVWQGVLLLFVYSLGLGIPFLLTALSLDWVAPFLRRLNRYGGMVSLASGILLVVTGVLVFTDALLILTSYLLRYLNPLL